MLLLMFTSSIYITQPLCSYALPIVIYSKLSTDHIPLNAELIPREKESNS